ncbi:MAG TPA: polysaccharide deacetylase family protein [Verrucomicrobiae bacterium]|nr:polysaccharide deacetylase family protein [Verrucomicrobiae bacterium]
MEKRLLKPVVLSAMILLATTVIPPAGFAGTVAAPYQLGTWEGFRPAAISYTFDDDCPNQYAIAVPMFHAAGIKMTLFTVTSWVTSWAQVQTAASYGDEIASHTVTHADLPNVPPAQLTNELASSQSIINSYITNQSCLTIAYPNCDVPNTAIVQQYYLAGRVCSGSLDGPSALTFMTLSSFILGNTGSYTNGANINALADSAVTQGRWCVYLTHAIDGDSGYSPLSSAALQASVNYTSTNQSKFWVETFGNVVRYIKERMSSSVTETTNTGSSITVQVTNNLDNTIYNYPITLRRPLPANWAAAAVTQNGQPITAQVVTLNSTNFVMFDVVPNGGDIVLTPSVLPFTLSSPTLTPPGSLTLQLNGQSNVTYTLYSSTDLLNWLPDQTTTLMGTSTNITVDASSNSIEFYRAQWSP